MAVVSEQWKSVAARYGGVTTQRELVRLVRDEYVRETGEAYSLRDAELIVERMVEHEYERIAGGAYDLGQQLCESGWTNDRCGLPLFHEGDHDNETFASVAKVAASTNDSLDLEDEPTFDPDAAHERWLETRYDMDEEDLRS